VEGRRLKKAKNRKKKIKKTKRIFTIPYE